MTTSKQAPMAVPEQSIVTERAAPAALSRRSVLQAAGLTTCGALIVRSRLGVAAAPPGAPVTAPVATPATVKAPVAAPVTAPVATPLTTPPPLAAPGVPMAYAYVAFEFNGSATRVASVEGGMPVGDVVLFPASPDQLQHKHLGNVSFEDLVIKIPLTSVAPPLLAWIQQSLAGSISAAPAALSYLDASGRLLKRVAFAYVVLSGVTFPACDATIAPAASLLTLRLTPSSYQTTGATGQATAAALQKPVATTNLFRFIVQGLESASGSVAKVGAITVTCKTPASPVGAVRESTAARVVECSNISLTLAETTNSPFYGWMNDTLLGGQRIVRAGRLDWIGPGGQAIASATFANLCVLRYEPAAYTAGAVVFSTAQVDMFCDSSNFTVA